MGHHPSPQAKIPVAGPAADETAGSSRSLPRRDTRSWVRPAIRRRRTSCGGSGHHLRARWRVIELMSHWLAEPTSGIWCVPAVLRARPPTQVVM